MTTYKYKFYNNKDNKHLDRTINLSGLLWNHCIALCRRHHRIYGKKPKTYDLSSHLVKIKKVKKFSWIAEIPSQSAQDVVERIDKAYRAFFSGLKRKVKTSPPKFRK